MTSPWLILAGLGAFHGLNPGMGWLFAVALGVHRRSRATVAMSIIPIAFGHALSVAAVVLLFVLSGQYLDPDPIRIAGAAILFGWAGYHFRYGHRHRVRVGLTTGLAGLALWSVAMATSHGAGLMLVPSILSLCGPSGSLGLPDSLAVSLAAVGVHTAAMIAVTALAAAAVYEALGVGFLRRGWINLDMLWIAALAGTATMLLA
jgi:hypothetical protein